MRITGRKTLDRTYARATNHKMDETRFHDLMIADELCPFKEDHDLVMKIGSKGVTASVRGSSSFDTRILSDAFKDG